MNCPVMRLVAEIYIWQLNHALGGATKLEPANFELMEARLSSLRVRPFLFIRDAMQRGHQSSYFIRTQQLIQVCRSKHQIDISDEVELATWVMVIPILYQRRGDEPIPWQIVRPEPKVGFVMSISELTGLDCTDEVGTKLLQRAVDAVRKLAEIARISDNVRETLETLLMIDGHES